MAREQLPVKLESACNALNSYAQTQTSIDISTIKIMKHVNWIYPLGSLLIIAGLSLAGLSEKQILDCAPQIFLLSLLIGLFLAIIGALFDRKYLSLSQNIVRGTASWLGSAISLILLLLFGNVHSSTALLTVPLVGGIISGAVQLSARYKYSS